MAARKPKTTKAEAKPAEDIVEAVAEEVVAPEGVAPETLAETVANAIVIEEPKREEAPEEPVVEEAAAEVTESAPAPVEKVVVRKGGFFPMLMGGVAAAVLGFGMARYVLPDDFPFPKAGSADTQAALEKVASEAKSADMVLAGRLEKLEAGPDLSGLTTATDAAKAAAEEASAKADALAERMTAFEASVADLAARPVTDAANPAAVAAYEAELSKLQTAMAEQRGALEALAKEAEDRRAAAQLTEQEAMVRNSITRIRIAVENGGPFAAELENLSAAGVEVPAVLAERAESGVPTIAALREAYPDAARAALAAARAGSTEGGIGAKITSLLGARSLAPKEGSDADAVLSRVEAALRDGRMNDALAEVETLPEVARVEMAGWLQLATERATALVALDALGAGVNGN